MSEVKKTLCQLATELHTELQSVQFGEDFSKKYAKQFETMAKHEEQTNTDLLLLGIYGLNALRFWKFKSAVEKTVEYAKKADYKREVTSTVFRHSISIATLALKGLDVWTIGGEHAHTGIVRRLICIDKGDKNTLGKAYVHGCFIDSLQSVIDGKAQHKSADGKIMNTLPSHLSDDAIAEQVFPLTADEKKKRDEEVKKEKLLENRMAWNTKGMTQEKVEQWYSALNADDKAIVNKAMAQYIVATVQVPTATKKRTKKELAGK